MEKELPVPQSPTSNIQKIGRRSSRELDNIHRSHGALRLADPSPCHLPDNFEAMFAGRDFERSSSSRSRKFLYLDDGIGRCHQNHLGIQGIQFTVLCYRNGLI
jgi:hypothetical protein